MIVVEGDEAFRQDVAVSLAEICPCCRHVVQTDGSVAVSHDPGGTVNRRCYCEHRAGCNLVSDLAAHAETTTIRETGQGNAYCSRTNTVSFNPDSREGGLNTHGDRLRPRSIGLAHALVHALNDHDRPCQMTRHQHEQSAQRGENQIRSEMHQPHRVCEPPQRCEPHSRCESLRGIDTADRYDCSCGSLWRLGIGSPRRVLRRLKLGVRHMLSRWRSFFSPPDEANADADIGTTGSLDSLQSGTGSVPVREVVGLCNAHRSTSNEHARVRALLEEFKDAHTVVALEGVDVESGRVSFTVVADDGRSVVAESNLATHKRNGTVAFGATQRPMRRSIPRTASAAPVSTLSATAFASGVGGAAIYDGTVQFITARHGDRWCEAALYGYRYPLLDPMADTSVESADRDRYQAICRTLEALHALS